MWHSEGPHTHAFTRMLRVSEAVAPVSQMAVRINLQSSVLNHCQSVQLSVIIQAEMAEQGPLHFSLSFSFHPFSLLFSFPEVVFELRI